MALTGPLIERHGLGRNDTFGAALLDIAQDHVLSILWADGLLGQGAVLKGGTSLRKCRLGPRGRFSTDIDLAVPSDDRVLEILDAVNGAKVAGFTFDLENESDDGRHWELSVTHEEFGAPDVPSSLEFARRPLALEAENLPFVHMPVHDAYEIDMPTAISVIGEVEACAEKLARYRRACLARDLYDLHYFASRPLDEPLVRRLWVLKVWSDVNDDRRGAGPIDVADMLRTRLRRDFAEEEIGRLTMPVDIDAWEKAVRRRFAFLAGLEEDEARWARCNAGDRYDVQAALATLGQTA